MNIETSKIINENYSLEDTLTHTELHEFLNQKLKANKKWFFYVYIIVLSCSLFAISFTVTKNIVTNDLSIANFIIYTILGILFSIAFIPLHELIHYLAYKICGAKSVSFFSNFKKFYFATIANKFVTNLSQFTFIAILPFIVVLVVTIALLPFVSIEFKITMLTFLFIHNLFCSGDFTLLNYLASNKGMVTYDDKEKRETYFYIKKSD